jgi:hypothetical protein
MWRMLALAALTWAIAHSAAKAQPLADELAVTVANRSEPELCAEKDNVELTFASPLVKSFRVQAVHPAFVGSIIADRYAPDFTSCDMSGDPVFAANARRVTFYETPDLWLTGYTYPSFWRPASVPFRVGNRVEEGLHVVQLWVRHKERAEEVLVIYPPDGYWRARPLPPAHMRWTAYGSSFLVGPVEVEGRPIVALKDIAFDPATKSFTMTFARGGSATLRLTTLDEDRFILDVSLQGTPSGAPFASLRSMYATEFNADMTRLAWRTKGGKGWGEAPVLDFKGAEATELWAGRLVPSRHNTSAPDMVFGRFSSGPLQDVPKLP